MRSTSLSLQVALPSLTGNAVLTGSSVRPPDHKTVYSAYRLPRPVLCSPEIYAMHQKGFVRGAAEFGGSAYAKTQLQSRW